MLEAADTQLYFIHVASPMADNEMPFLEIAHFQHLIGNTLITQLIKA